MSDKYSSKLISGSKWRVNQFVGKKAFKLLVEVLQLFGPSISQLFNAAPKGASILDIDQVALSPIIQMLVTKLDPEANLDLLQRLLTSTSCDGVDLDDGNFDLVFQGRILTLFKVIIFVLEVNYKDFLEESGLTNRAKEAKQKLENTTSTSKN